jgi:hypothetical protein
LQHHTANLGSIPPTQGNCKLKLAFCVSLLLFSFVPISIFLAFIGVSGGIGLAVAGTGIAIVQGIAFAFGAFVLFWWLLGALFFAGLVTIWFTVGYFGLKTAKKLAA